MIRYVLIAGAGLLVAACGVSTSSSDDPAAVCTGLLGGDPEIGEDLANHGEDVAAYCGCYASQIDAQGTANKATILKTSQILADLRKKRRINVDDAADLLLEDPDGSAYGVTEAEFQVTERYVERMRRELFDAGGLCNTAGED